MAIANSTIDAVRSIDIFDVINREVPLKKAGAAFKGCCPFHDEKTASFTVNPARQRYKCFGCGASGDGLQFVMQNDKVDFAEAVESLAKSFNIKIEYTDSDSEPPLPKEERQLLGLINKAVADIYSNALEKNGEAMQYLRERGFGESVCNVWGIGYAPGDVIHRWGVANAYTQQLETLGLVKAGERGPYDFFRQRIIFPILDHNATVVGFGGRIFNVKHDAKYLNSEESLFYNKSAVLYGLYQALPGIKEHGFAILVEGYTDVISMHEAGATNTVATCGTALTEHHAKLLKRFTKEVLIMRDGDKAGRAAIRKDLYILLDQGFNVRVHMLEEGQDPDTFAKQYTQ